MKPDFPTQLDTTIRPQDDFFNHVNGKWIASHPIPDSEVRWGTFTVLRDESWRAMREIYESLADTDASVGSIEQQAKDFYASGMNYDLHEKEHIDLIHTYFQAIDAITDSEGLSAMFGDFQRMHISCPWFVWIDTDHDDSRRHILHFYQGGLTLPSRDYYLDETEEMTHIQDAYKDFTSRIHASFPELAPNSALLWKTLIEFETAIAKASRSAADLRDVEKNFNKTTYSQLQQDYPAINWKSYASHLNWQPSDRISVDQPEFLSFAATAMHDQSLEAWKIYLKWRLLTSYLGKISERFAELSFSFFGKVLSGTKEMQPLWKRVVLSADSAIGEATGKLYAQKHFPESSKQQVLDLVEMVRTAYGERIKNLEWMSDPTKAYALKKLTNMKVLIGYPDVWRDFSGLAITPRSYLQNTINARKFDMDYWLGRLEEPTSRDDWFMNPQTVNAYNDPTRLVICFPAAILQQPFFDPHASFEANMGGIGTVIGHELTHGFDDQGYQFDAEGNVKPWQTEEERRAFAKRAQVIIDHADSYPVFSDLNLKGKLVVGESIADLGGLEIALHTLSMHKQPTQEDLQKFFLSYAFTECGSTREEKLREQTLTDPHPVPDFRVNGVLQHVDAFYSTFDVHENDSLYRSAENRARIW